VLDEATGKVITEVDGLAAFDRTGPLLRLQGTREPPGRLSVSVLSARTGKFEPRGTIDPVSDSNYLLRGNLLVHVGLTGRLTVTDVG